MSWQRLWHEAAALAARAHRHQLRKDGETPYATHTARVALVVATLFGVDDEAVLAAALLHDVIEDTPLDYDDLLEGFGVEVADLCAALTKDMRLVEPERERAYDAQLAAAPWQARLIKLADVYDNATDAETVECDPLVEAAVRTVQRHTSQRDDADEQCACGAHGA